MNAIKQFLYAVGAIFFFAAALFSYFLGDDHLSTACIALAGCVCVAGFFVCKSLNDEE